MKTIIIDGVEYNLTPKVAFCEGDWVVSPNGVYWHIDAINNNRYEVSSTDGACADWPLDTDLYHLWSIEDAKDGDVLACGNDIVIFKENSYNPKDQSGCMFVYCAFNKCGYWYEIGGINPTCYKPATKEQRDTLMKAMVDARYEWDAEKKELKRIEQKQVWSEENKTIIDSLLDVLYRIKKGKDPQATTRLIEQHINFIKSLRPQNKWNPSDEQMYNLSEAAHYNCAFFDMEILKELYDDLKKLREE